MMALMESSSAKRLQLADDFVGIENHAVEIDDADLVAEGVEPGLLLVRVHRDIDQRKHGQHKEEESASSDYDPEPDARTCVFSHKVVSSLALIGGGIALGGDDDLADAFRSDAELHRRLADVLAVGINVEGSIRFRCGQFQSANTRLRESPGAFRNTPSGKDRTV